MVHRIQVERSKAIQRRTGKTFHFATRLLPRRVRHPTYVLYAFFRVADEVVDDADGVPSEEQRAELERLRAEALGRRPASNPVLEAFDEVRERYGIEEADVNAFVDAMLTDITKSRYATYDELEAYMDGSAASVGRMMTAIMDPREPERALPHAAALGQAFQLSNFLRDVREDAVERDRVYLPAETLDEHGVADETLRRLEMTEEFAAAMRAELARAETLYEAGVAGIEHLPADCRFAVLLASVLYADHHRSIRRLGYDVLSTTPSLSLRRTVSLLARTRWHWARTKDPEVVFRRVSTLPDVGERSAAVERVDGLPAP